VLLASITKNINNNDYNISRYITHAIEGEIEQVTELVDSYINAGKSVKDILLKMFMPALVNIGELWHKGLLNIAEEHLAVTVTISQIERITHSLIPSGQIIGTAAICTPVGEKHFIGPKVVSELMRLSGWNVHFLGTEMPTTDLVQFLSEKSIDLLVLSIALYENLPGVLEIISAVKDLDKSVITMIGGSGVASLDEKSLEGVDIISSDVTKAIIEASRLVSSSTANGNLEDYLNFIGEKVKMTRILKGWNQQKLADESGLDRTYISSVENGKQNLTLGVLLRIANAFGIDIQTLIYRD
jgi:methanogenic corrinoid protein MtbC1/DNA-binding XRE family transcriptional regulator